jgi:hypothetical protein
MDPLGRRNLSALLALMGGSGRAMSSTLPGEKEGDEIASRGGRCEEGSQGEAEGSVGEREGDGIA